MENILCSYGWWLECCRERSKMGLQEWAFCLDLKTDVYNSIITGDFYPDEVCRQSIFTSITKLTLDGIR